MMSSILTVFRKEVLDNLRDRRTLLTAILLGPLMGPVLFGAVINFTVPEVRPSAQWRPQMSISVPIVGAEHAANLVAFLASRGIWAARGHVLKSIDEAVNAVRSGEHEVVVFIDASFGEELASGAGAHVSLVYDVSDPTSRQHAGRIRGSVIAYSQQIGTLRLLARGLDPSVVRPLIIDDFDVSTANERNERSSFLLGMLADMLAGMLTYFLLFATLMGGFYLATDTTAGERERKSLEPLLATPVPRSSLLLGKMGATVAFMLLSLAITLAGYAVAVRFMPFEELGMSSSFDPGTTLIAFLVLVPFAPLGAALMTAVASFTKSYKEAQTYLGFVILVPTLPVIVASAMNVRPSLALMAVPSLSQHLLITKLIRAEPIEASMLALSVASTLLLAALLAYAAIRLYQRERILG